MFKFRIVFFMKIYMSKKNTKLYRNEKGIYLKNKDVLNKGLWISFTVDGREYVELNVEKYWCIDKVIS